MAQGGAVQNFWRRGGLHKRKCANWYPANPVLISRFNIPSLCGTLCAQCMAGNGQVGTGKHHLAPPGDLLIADTPTRGTPLALCLPATPAHRCQGRGHTVRCCGCSIILRGNMHNVGHRIHDTPSSTPVQPLAAHTTEQGTTCYKKASPCTRSSHTRLLLNRHTMTTYVTTDSRTLFQRVPAQLGLCLR